MQAEHTEKMMDETCTQTGNPGISGGIGEFIVWLAIGEIAGFGAFVIYTTGSGIRAWHDTQSKSPAG